MKNITVFGSLAYDRIMTFPDTFSKHILADRIDSLNICFQVDGVQENFGGTAGNIVYAMRLMGESPRLSATIGSDYHSYFKWFEDNGISTEDVHIIESELTAGAYITTDSANNQITNFNPGAMKYSSELDIGAMTPGDDIVLVSPGNLEDMINYPRSCRKHGIDYIFDPGQALPMLAPEDLKEVIKDCMLLIVNEYEFDLLREKCGLKEDELLQLPKVTIITMGERGSVIRTPGTFEEIPVTATTNVIDPTGAGDAYRGGLISGLLQGKDLKESAKLGSVCASFAVECDGTQEYSFTKDEFQTRLNS